MKITTKKLPKSQIEISIEVPNEDFAPFRQKAVQKLAGQVNIPGFRKGHVPEKKLIEQFGEQGILAEAAEAAIPNVLTKAILQESISPITRPDVQLISLTPFSFSATVTVFPEIKMGKWEEAGVPKKEVVIKKKEIDEVTEQLRERFMERKPVDRAAKNDDFVEVSFSGKTPDGVPLDGTESKCHPLVLGSKQFISGFEEELVGMKKDEKKSFTITFPKDYGATHLAGKPVIFDVKMLSVAEQIKPEVNDELAEKIFGKKMSVSEMEKEIETMLKEKGEEEERARRENELIQKWEDSATVEMPEIIVEEELKNLTQVMQQRAQMAGVGWEQYLQNMKKTEEDFEKEMRPEAEKRAKQRLVVGKVIAEAKPEASDDEIEKEAIALMHSQHQHAPGESCSHDVPKDSDTWQQAAHKVRVEKLFDRFLGEHPAKKLQKKQEEEKK